MEGIVVQKDIIRMSVKEARRLTVISRVIEGGIRQVEASDLLELTTRQIRRIVRRVSVEGEKGVIHRSRGRGSNRSLPRKTKERVLQLYKGRYPDFGPTLASEKLLEEEGIAISDETLRLWLLEAGIPYRKRRSRAHRRWRERKRCFGEMVQIDGSHHDWLEGRGPQMVLMGYIDDATGNVFGRFYEYEGTVPCFDSIKRYIKKYKLPHSVYLDKHSTYYNSNAKQTIEEELSNRRPQSQFERAMGELGIRVIHANSPQAKGRIERLFRTFQDRLVKELRLAGVTTRAGANRLLGHYLPKYNRRFKVPAVCGVDLHRQVPDGQDLNSILCVKEPRVIKNDFTVSYKGKLLQICETTRCRKVVVEEWLNGSIHIRHKGREIRHKRITSRPGPATEPPRVKLGHRTVRKPWGKHPWRRSYKTMVASTKTGHF
jgi:transposase